MLPSKIGKISRCTPCLETSWPLLALFVATLSISSMKIIPICSANSSASWFAVSWSINSSAKSSAKILRAVLTGTSRSTLRLGMSWFIMSCICWFWFVPSMPSAPGSCSTLILTFSSSSLPSNNCFLISERLVLISSVGVSSSSSSLLPKFGIAPPSNDSKGLLLFDAFFFILGTSNLTNFSLALLTASSLTKPFFWSLTSLTATSTRSRTILSTSRPTYPTSVNLVASTLINGAPTTLAIRLAISVLPTPVGPIIKIFLGAISCLVSSSSKLLL